MENNRRNLVFELIVVGVDLVCLLFIILYLSLSLNETSINLQNQSINTQTDFAVADIETTFNSVFLQLEVAASVVVEYQTNSSYSIDEIIENEITIDSVEGNISHFDYASGGFFERLAVTSQMHGVGDIAIINSQGQAYSTLGTSFAKDTYVEDIQKNNKVIEYKATSVYGQPALIFALPIVSNDTVIGTICTHYGKEEIQNLFPSNPFNAENSVFGMMSISKMNIMNRFRDNANVDVSDKITLLNEFQEYVSGIKEKNYITRFIYNNEENIVSVSDLELNNVSLYWTDSGGTIKNDSWYIFSSAPLALINEVNNISPVALIVAIFIILIMAVLTVLSFQYISKANAKGLAIINKEANQAKKDLNDFVDRIPIGLVKFEISSSVFKLIYYSKSFLTEIQYSDESIKELVSNNEEKKIIHNDDFASLIKTITRFSDTDKQLSHNFRVVSEIGEIVWIRISGYATLSDMHYYFIGSVIDITKERTLETDLSIERIRYKIALKSLNIIVFDYDCKNDHIEFFSRISHDEQEKTKIITNFVKEDKIRKVLKIEKGAEMVELLTGDGNRVLETRGIDITKGDDYHWLRINSEQIFDDDNQLIRTIGTISIIDEQKNFEQQLLEQSRMDLQTQLLNKVTFENLVANCLQYDKCSALAIIDIDNFKGINDTQGHLFADTILISLSSQLKEFVGKLGFVGRVGGDEFAVYLNRYASLEHLEKFVGEICNLYRTSYTNVTRKCSLSCSIGVAQFPDDGKTYAEVFKNADVALYLAKNKGKDRYEIYNKNVEVGHISGYYNNYDNTLDFTKSDFLNSILAYSFDIIEHSSDLMKSTKILFSRMGSLYRLNRITMFNIDESAGVYTANIQWTEKATSFDGVSISFTKEDAADYQALEKDSAIIVDDISRVSNLNMFKSINDRTNLKAFVISNLYQGEKIVSSILYEGNTDIRVWTYEEVQAFTIFSKVVLSYIMRIQTLNEKNVAVDKIMSIDSLTGLYTQYRFNREGDRMLEDKSKMYVSFYTDIINFKHFNDKYGYDVGDMILKRVATVITETFPKDTFIAARVGADGFNILLQYHTIAEIKDYLRTSVGNGKLNVVLPNGLLITNIYTKSGVYFVRKGDSIKHAIDNANMARKSIRLASVDTYAVFDESIMLKYNKESEIIRSAKTALDNQEFLVYYQPKYDMLTGKTSGAEALVRWLRKGKVVSPGEFIPIFENNGFVTKIDFFVYEEVAKLLSTKVSYNKLHGPISVNVSRLHLLDDEFIPKLKALLEKYRIEPRQIEFEITEGLFFDNKIKSIGIINELRSLGYTISIDDFGSGYSSLNILEEINANVIKLDKSFLPGELDKDERKRKQIIVKHVIAMANNMRMDVICEGVETEEQVALLRKLGCYHAQGYYYSRPLPEQDFLEIVEKQDFIPDEEL